MISSREIAGGNAIIGERLEQLELEKLMSCSEVTNKEFDHLQYIALQRGYGLFDEQTKKFRKSLR